jgi:hypothetical protein
MLHKIERIRENTIYQYKPKEQEEKDPTKERNEDIPYDVPTKRRSYLTILYHMHGQLCRMREDSTRHIYIYIYAWKG